MNLLLPLLPYMAGGLALVGLAVAARRRRAFVQVNPKYRALLCRHGRATPLVWLTVDTATLKDRRNGYEYRALVRLAEVLPADVRVIGNDERSGPQRQQD